MPLDPNAAAKQLPRSQIAQVSGPIAKIDGKNVMEQGGTFDLLPGCHIVELDRRMTSDSYDLSGATYMSGQFASTVYAFRMKAGARYVIRRDTYTEGIGQAVRVSLSAREEQASGAATDLVPAKSADDIKTCRE